MLIEGENLQVLRILQKSYYGKVKMIYIDPPYNTGNDSFVYPDDYSETLAEYQRRTGDRNEAGFLNRQSLWKKNTKENGHYHSAWLSMMYPRLYLARNLLRDDGVIFISIDDNEAANLKLLCDEIFGEENFICNFIWKSKLGKVGTTKTISTAHEYIICYSRNAEKVNFSMLEKQKDGRKENLRQWGQADRKEDRPSMFYPIEIQGIEVLPIKDDGSEGRWRVGKETALNLLKNGELELSIKNDKYQIYRIFPDNVSIAAHGSIIPEEVGTTANGAKLLSSLGMNGFFDYSKPVSLIKFLANLNVACNDLVLDFFAGSGTTMQAVMELNLEDGGKRQCICVQIPEKLEENSEAYQAGYRSIADITRARIAKVIEKLKKEQPEKTAGLACAQFTLSPSHFRQWRTDVKEDQLHGQLEIFRQSEKASPQTGHAQTAMLAELLLKMGLGALGVQAIAKSETVAGLTVHRVLLNDNRELWLCFEPYQSALKDEIAKARPAQVVLLNSCFTGEKADEQLANLQLELQGLDITLTVI